MVLATFFFTVTSHSTHAHHNMVPTTNFDCRTRTSGFYASPSSCDMYYICAGPTAFEVVCASGLYFNEATGLCDWPKNVKCSHNSSPTSTTMAPVTSSPSTNAQSSTKAPVTQTPVTQKLATNAPTQSPTTTAIPVTTVPTTQKVATNAPTQFSSTTTDPVTQYPTTTTTTQAPTTTTTQAPTTTTTKAPTTTTTTMAPVTNAPTTHGMYILTILLFFGQSMLYTSGM